METYLGGVFSHAIEGGRAGASLRVDGSVLVGVTASGERFELDLRHCQVDLGGNSGRMWFCRPRDGGVTFYSEQPGFGQALWQVPGLSARVEQLLARRSSRRKRTAVLALTVLAGFGGLLVGGYYALRSAGRAAVLALPTSVDERIGKLAVRSMPLQGPVVDDALVKRGVDRIVQRLGDHAEGGFDYNVRVVQAPVMNAFALPGGEIVVYTGLLKGARSADEVAAVVAHEISHVTLRHGLERIAHSVGLAAMVQLFLGDVSGLAALGVELIQNGALTSYGRDQERQADMAGLRLLVRAGIDPLSLAEIFEQLKKDAPDVPEAIAWLSSHPDLDERIQTVRQAAQQLGEPQLAPLDVDFAAVRQALGAPLPAGSAQGGDGAGATMKGSRGGE